MANPVYNVRDTGRNSARTGDVREIAENIITSVTSVTFVMNSLVTLVISFVMNSFVILKTTGIGGGGGIRTTTEDCLNVSTTPLVR